MADAGLFRLVLPRELGGYEADPLTCMRVVEEVSRADGSAGWLTVIGALAGFAASLPA